MKKRFKKIWKTKYIVLTVLVLTIGMCAYFGFKGYAAGVISLEVNGKDVTHTTVDLRDSSLQIEMKSTGTMYDDSDLYEVDWSIGYGDGTIASVDKSSFSQTVGIVTALSPGTVRITVIVRDKLNGLAELASTTCDVRVFFSIKTTGNDAIYKYIYDDSTERSLVLYADEYQEPNLLQLELNFGNPTDAQWISSNSEVINVDQYTGKAKPVGAGRTVITATYTPVGSTSTETAVLPVYIIPRFTDNEPNYLNRQFYRGHESKLDRGDFIYLDTYFGNDNIEPLSEKVVWVIKQDNGSGGWKVIANSIGLNSSLISLVPVSSKSSLLGVQAKAGTYLIEFYAAGTYQSESRKMTNACSSINLTVYANFDNYIETLQVGDSYNIANAFNLTIEDFTKFFLTPVLTYGSGMAANYADYIASTATITTKGVATINAKTTVNPSYAKDVRELTRITSPVYDRPEFNITLNIMDSFVLDFKNYIMYVGEQKQLNPIFSSSTSGRITWTSSNPTVVSVNSQGVMTGLKTTKGIPDVIITASLVDETSGSAIIKNATCSVKVEDTVSGFTLTPSELSLEVGNMSTVKANITQNVTTAPLLWKSMDSSIATVEPSADMKSAVVTARKGGQTYIIVTNLQSGEQVSVKVTVLIGIKEISFDEPSITAKMITNPTERAITLKYEPKDANSTDIVWTSQDPNIATIETAGTPSNGIIKATITMKKVPTTNTPITLMATPKYNPNGKSAISYLTVVAAATKMTISPTTLVLNAKSTKNEAEKRQLEYVLEPIGCTTSLTFTSSNNNVADVSDTGMITAKKTGKALISIRSEEGLIQYCEVTVLQPCDTLVFNPATYTMNSDTSYQPKLTMTPTDTTDSITWKSFNTSVATVDENGVIKAVKGGLAVIQAVANSGATAFIDINVRDAVKSMELNFKSYTIEKDQSFTLIPKITPDNAFDKSVKWSSSNSSVVSTEEKIENGTSSLKVTGKSGGVAVITATTNDGGYMASCLVVVKEKSTKVTVSPQSKYLKLKSSFTVTANVATVSATNKKVKWSTSNKKIATVTSAGKVTGKKLGTAYITAKSTDGSNVSASCKVMVIRPVTKVRLNKYTAKLKVGSTMVLKKYISPKNASVKSVTWSSSDNNTATVDSSGRVLGLAPGLVKIRAKANDGSGKSAICLVNVIEPVEAVGVSVTQSELIVARGRKIQSGIAVSPLNSTDAIKYFSDDKRIAVVDKRGKISTKKTGQVSIYGKTVNGKYGYVDVLVVAMNRGSLKMRQYDKETLSVNEIKTGVTWHSANPLIASVKNGSVLGRRPGKTTIYATVRGLRLPCRVKIKRIT